MSNVFKFLFSFFLFLFVPLFFVSANATTTHYDVQSDNFTNGCTYINAGTAQTSCQEIRVFATSTLNSWTAKLIESNNNSCYVYYGLSNTCGNADLASSSEFRLWNETKWERWTPNYTLYPNTSYYVTVKKGVLGCSAGTVKNKTSNSEANYGYGLSTCYGQSDAGDVNATSTITKLEICGDKYLDDNEECDDGNTTNGDKCSSSCMFEACPTTEPNCDLIQHTETVLLFEDQANDYNDYVGTYWLNLPVNNNYISSFDIDIYQMSGTSTVSYCLVDSFGGDCISSTSTVEFYDTGLITLTGALSQTNSDDVKIKMWFSDTGLAIRETNGDVTSYYGCKDSAYDCTDENNYAYQVPTIHIYGQSEPQTGATSYTEEIDETAVVSFVNIFWKTAFVLLIICFALFGLRKLIRHYFNI